MEMKGEKIRTTILENFAFAEISYPSVSDAVRQDVVTETLTKGICLGFADEFVAYA
jgi:hypothetical protein